MSEYHFNCLLPQCSSQAELSLVIDKQGSEVELCPSCYYKYRNIPEYFRIRKLA